jgi:hypothetical protein
MTLTCSRYNELAINQRVETLFGCNRQAFERVGGT